VRSLKVFLFPFTSKSFFLGGGSDKKKRQHQKPGAGLPFYSMARASLLPLPRSIRGMKPISFLLPPFGVRGGKEGGGREGVWGSREQEERAARAAFFDVPLFSCRQLFLFPLWLLLTRAGLTTRLPYPRGSLPFYSPNAESHYFRGHTTKKKKKNENRKEKTDRKPKKKNSKIRKVHDDGARV